MVTLADYKGLQVIDPDPSGNGGLAINENFKHLADATALARRDSDLVVNPLAFVSAGLLLDMKANETWAFEFNLLASDLDDQLGLRTIAEAPANSSGRYTLISVDTQVVKSADIGMEIDNIAISSGSDSLIQVKGIVVAGADGVLDLKLRNQSGVAANTFSEFSNLNAQRIS